MLRFADPCLKRVADTGDKRGHNDIECDEMIVPHNASQVLGAPMSLKSTPPFALSSFADSTMVIVTALGSTL